MDNMGNILQAICIGFVVATFLLSTGRGLQAITVCKECLTFLNNEVLKKKEQYVNAIEISIYQIIFRAYCLTDPDTTNAINYGKKLLDIYRDRGETAEEGNLTHKLAHLCDQQYRYTEAKELYKRAISIMKLTGNRKGEASAYGNIGIMSYVLGEYDKAIEYLGKDLAIRIEIGDRQGIGTAYGNLGAVFKCLGKYDKAKECFGKTLAIRIESGDRNGEANCYGNLGVVFKCLSYYDKAKECFDNALAIRIEIGDKKGIATDYENLGTVFQSLGEYEKAKEYIDKALEINIETGERNGEASCYGNLGAMFKCLGTYGKAKECLDKALTMRIEIGDRQGEAADYGNLGTVFQSLGEYDKAKEYLDKALAITTEIGDRAGEAANYGNLGNVFHSLGEFHKAKEYLEKALAIKIEIGDREGEASCHGSLGTVLRSLSEYDKAKEHIEKGLAIRTAIGDRAGIATDYGNLGNLFHSLGEYDKGKEYLEKSLAIRIEIGDREGEAADYGNLGTVFQSLCEYNKSKQHLEKALAIRMEIGDRAGEATDYGNLGNLFHSLGEYHKAKEYLERALAIKIEIGERNGEAACCGNLGTVLKSLGEYDKAKELIENGLAIRIEIGDRAGEAIDHANLGTVFHSLGEYEKAKEYLEKSLAIAIEIGDRQGQAVDYGNLGVVFRSLGEYEKAKEYLDKALAIRIEIGDRDGEARDYGNLGTVFNSLGEYDKAKEYFEKALQIRIEIGDRAGEATDYGNLGLLFYPFSEHVAPEDYFEKALSIAQDIGLLEKEIDCLSILTRVKLYQFKSQEAFNYLILCLLKSENLRSFLRDNDQFKISFPDVRHYPYRTLSKIFCCSGKPIYALYVLELARARALADLLASQYDVHWQITAYPQSWIGIENIMKKERNCTCVYVSYQEQDLLLWILKTSGAIYFRKIAAGEDIVGAGLADSLDDFFAKGFRSYGILSEEDCEDRSLNDFELGPDSSQHESLVTSRQVRGVEDDPELRLTLFYNMIIAPVADLLKGPEIIIIPELCLYRVPFSALRDESGKYLSETYRIRIVPSLTTLKFIQDSPPDYHRQTGALVVGDPDVGRVRYKGKKKYFSRLPHARNEAAMIGRLLGVQPLLGQHATKQAVLEGLHTKSLIHFAAHGNAETGEIALSPVRSPNILPKEGDYLLTMSDISKVQLRAKLVVLSCCHSGRGQIRAEGVIGIARAFLGSGARSVLVALWAIDDRATEQLMSRFYEHLVRRGSASESLHEAMKWMRANGFAKVCDWASFMLIGDNVTLDFEKQEPVSSNRETFDF